VTGPSVAAGAFGCFGCVQRRIIHHPVLEQASKMRWHMNVGHKAEQQRHRQKWRRTGRAGAGRRQGQSLIHESSRGGFFCGGLILSYGAR
jgi:hypothetical protein